MSLHLLNLLHAQRLDLLEGPEADEVPALDEEAWITPHTDLLDAYADLGLDLVDGDLDREPLRAALRRLVDLVFAAGYGAGAVDNQATQHLPGPRPEEPDEVEGHE
jgi:hypothetical protein